jgi:hypothetical protein
VTPVERRVIRAAPVRHASIPAGGHVGVPATDIPVNLPRVRGIPALKRVIHALIHVISRVHEPVMGIPVLSPANLPVLMRRASIHAG